MKTKTPNGLRTKSNRPGVMHILICILFSYVSLFAESDPDQLIAALTKHPASGESYPLLPAFSSTMHGEIVSELEKSPTVRASIQQLDATHRNVVWFAAIESLEQQKAIWSLQASLCHPSEDVQIHALRALGRLKDARSVPFLLIYADFMAVMEGGSENATIHGIVHESIAGALSSITGVSVTLNGQDPEGLKSANRKWTKWQLDHSK